MATKITDLTGIPSLADGDLFEIVDVSDTTDDPAGSSFKVPLSDISAAVIADLAIGETKAPQKVAGTTDTLAAGDSNRLTVYTETSSQVTVTVPTGTFTANEWFILQTESAGGLTLSTSGLTLNGSAPNTSIDQNEAIVVWFTGANEISVFNGTST